MGERDEFPDETLVVRCGLPPLVNSPLLRACDRHPEGPYGFSVQSAPGLTIEQLAAGCRNNYVGYTTVGAIRSKGYRIVRTSGVAYHATVEVPVDWSLGASEELTSLFAKAKNPAPRR
jgi:hypothetical protein